MSREKNSYRFALVLSGVSDQTPGFEDALYEAGCDDALINFKGRTVYLDFDREAGSLEEAVVSAIHDVEKADIGAYVISASPEHLVSISDIARRAHLTRQAISLLVKGMRCDGTFPPPILKIDNRSVLWRWSQVVEWLYLHGKVQDHQLLEDARMIEDINAALEMRDKKTLRHRQSILKRLQGS